MKNDRTNSIPLQSLARGLRTCGVSMTLLVVLSGCSFLNDAVWPSLSGAEPTVAQEVASTVPSKVAEEVPAPLFDDASFNEALDGPQKSLTSIAAREPDFQTRLVAAQQALAARAVRVETPPSMPSESKFDRWASAQIELSRLNDDIISLDILADDVAASTADIAVAVAQLTALGQISDIAAPDAARLTAMGRQANELLVRLGRLQQKLSTDQQRWANYAQAQTNRIGVRQAGAILEPGEVSSKPPASVDPAAEEWPESGDRFKGRKPLMSVNFSDSEIAYKDELRSLMQRVQGQYPDIALDIEVVGVDRAEVQSVIRLLADLDVDARAYRTMRVLDAAPELLFFPR